VRDIAAEMLSIQAVRSAQQGHAFPPTPAGSMNSRTASSTRKRPINGAPSSPPKADMEAAKPMDRLICGDVGYGKTEVAIRAAFKAALAGKQVAVLVPTTVLAQQHFNTFRERMADYPMRIELLSRFRSRREQARVIGNWRPARSILSSARIALVASDIHFKDLGWWSSTRSSASA
jgi:transcription-repair coupling factor (superfamily II helicase)